MKNRELLQIAVREEFHVTDWSLEGHVLTADISIGYEITPEKEITVKVSLEDLVQSAMELNIIEGGDDEEVTLELNDQPIERPTDLWWAGLPHDYQEEIVKEAIEQDIKYALSKNWFSFVENEGVAEIKKLSPICQMLAQEATNILFEAELLAKVAA